MIDMHCHVLPGVDDGSANAAETRELLQMAWNQGVDSIIATPHFSHHTDFAKLKERLQLTKEIAKKIDPSFQIFPGQEIMYFEEIIDWLDRKRALTLAESRYVLVEFQPGDKFIKLQRAVRELVSAGYLPVIAHVERYQCLREKGRTAELIGNGAYLQVNSSTVTGGLFDRDAGWCRHEIAEKRIHFVASDMHDPKHRPPHMQEAYRKLKKYGPAVPKRLMELNQTYILKDRVLK